MARLQGVGDAEVAAAGYAQLHEGVSPITAMAVRPQSIQMALLENTSSFFLLVRLRTVHIFIYSIRAPDPDKCTS